MALNFSELTFKKLYDGIQDSLRTVYAKSNAVFSAASPYGQLLETVQNLFKLNTLQQKNIVRQYDITDPANNNKTAVRGLAVLGQHNPTRAIAASGTLQLQVKPGIDLATEVPGGQIIIYNETQVRNMGNNLVYSVDLGTERIVAPVSAGSSVYLNVVQGTWVKPTYTGRGEPTQSFNVSTSGTSEVDHFRFELRVNSQRWESRKAVRDMLPDEQTYVARTGILGGMDVIFGNQYYGAIPPLSSLIEVKYLATDGQKGNVANPQPNEFQFIGQGYDAYGNQVDLSAVFDVTVSTPVQFGADGESVAFTKSMLPYVSSNFVLARPENFVFYLKRLGVFSVVDAYVPDPAGTDQTAKLLAMANAGSEFVAKAYDAGRLGERAAVNLLTRHTSELERTRKLILSQAQSNVVNLFLVPDISNYYGYNTSFDYFTVPNDAFVLDAVEKARIMEYLTRDGVNHLVNEIKIVDATVKRYVITVVLHLFANAVVDNVQAEIRARVSDYFIAQKRRDRIPPSDLVKLVDDIYGVDSADVTFLSEDTERYHAEYLSKNEAFQLANGREPLYSEVTMDDGDVYDPAWTPGLDAALGDIVIGKQELPLIRGGWSDRNGNVYAAQPVAKGLGPLNIVIVPVSTQSKTQQNAQAKSAAAESALKANVVAPVKSNIGMGHAL